MRPSEEHLLRELAPQVLGAVVRRYGDFGAAEDAVQEALTAAAFQWPESGVPENPRAWLIQVAARKLTDQIRSQSARRRRETTSVLEEENVVPPPDESPVEQDDSLVLLFMCCHPALAIEAQVALTLRAVAGLTTEEIARAFLVPAETMKRRLTRAKSKIKVAGIPFGVPVASQLPERLAAVLAVVYLIFNEGYSGPGQPAESLASEAIRLGRVLAALLPAEPEVLGLLALMLLHDARREARFDGQDLVLLPDQDQSRWDWRQITEARDLLDHALLDPSLQHGPTARGPYALQAAVASLQAETPLDWPQVAALYGELADRTGSDVVRLNRAVAIAEAGDPAAALVIVDGLDPPGYQYWHSTRAELLRRLGRAAEARAAYREALALARTVPERRFLERRIAET